MSNQEPRRVDDNDERDQREREQYFVRAEGMDEIPLQRAAQLMGEHTGAFGCGRFTQWLLYELAEKRLTPAADPHFYRGTDAARGMRRDPKTAPISRAALREWMEAHASELGVTHAGRWCGYSAPRNAQTQQGA